MVAVTNKNKSNSRSKNKNGKVLSQTSRAVDIGVDKRIGKNRSEKRDKIKDWNYVSPQGLSKRGYVVDKELSGKDWTVYYNPRTKKSSIRYRETDPTNFKDLTTDILVATGTQHYGSRFNRSIGVYDRAVQKYGQKNVNVFGHSLGGSIALEVNKERGAKAWAYNPGGGPVEFVKHKYRDFKAILGNKKSKRQNKNIKEKAQIRGNIGDPLSFFSHSGGDYKHDIVQPKIGHSQSSLR